MKKDSLNNFGLFIMRISLGAIMLTHGIPKLKILFAGNGGEWLNPIGIGATPSLALAGTAECLGSLCIMLGIFTRVSSAVLAFNMAVAAFIFHSNDPFAVAELAFVFFTMYMALAFLGAGDFSLTHYLYRRKFRNL